MKSLLTPLIDLMLGFCAAAIILLTSVKFDSGAPFATQSVGQWQVTILTFPKSAEDGDAIGLSLTEFLDSELLSDDTSAMLIPDSGSQDGMPTTLLISWHQSSGETITEDLEMVEVPLLSKPSTLSFFNESTPRKNLSVEGNPTQAGRIIFNWPDS